MSSVEEQLSGSENFPGRPDPSRYGLDQLVYRVAGRHGQTIFQSNHLADESSHELGAGSIALVSLAGIHSACRTGFLFCRRLETGAVFILQPCLHAGHRVLGREHEFSCAGYDFRTTCSPGWFCLRCFGIFFTQGRTHHHAVSGHSSDHTGICLFAADSCAVWIRAGSRPDRQRFIFLRTHGAKHDPRASKHSI